MRIVGIGIGLVALALATGAAHADVTYRYAIASTTGTVVTTDGVTNDGSAFTGFPLTLTFTAAGVASGEVSGFEVAGFPNPQVSGLQGFTALATYDDGATPGSLYGALALDVKFSRAGQITSSSIQFQGRDIGFDIENGAAQFSSDGVLGCTASLDSGACTATGAFVPAPEPPSAALLLAALLVGALVTRQRIRSSAMRWLFGLLLAFAFGSAASAQIPASSLPQNLLVRPLPTTAADPSNMTMKAAVLLMRHGVRPPTSTSKFQPYAALPFPSNGASGWNAPDGNLTPYGAHLIQALGYIERGLYAAKGIVSRSGCPSPGEVFVWGDNADQRTQATAQFLLAGMYNGCTIPHFFSGSATPDPMFSSPFTLPNTAAATSAVLARMGGSIATAQNAVADLLAQLGNTLGCCSATLCAQNGLSAGCTYSQFPAAITASGGTLSFTGPLATGSSIAQVFELEYENGFTSSNLGFGLLSEQGVQTLEQLYTTKYDVFDRTPILAQLNGSTVAQAMLDAVLAAAPGQTVPAGAAPPKANLTVFVGHDSTLAALGGMLNLHWSFPTYPADDMPAGTTVGFEVFADASGALFVRPVALVLTLDAMHAGVPAAYYRAPSYEALQLPGCSLDSMRLCTLQDFVTLMTAAIVPAYVAIETYQ